ncbi:hypothetical protein FKP32DRAFT_1607540 [Trametes sanguinea]|nr:hypothetical protein FKP32DRAFT_1607540 [Trametes sanguinea]
MNFTAAPRTAAAQSVSQVLFVAVEALEGGALTGCCPVGRMLELIQAGLRLVLIGAASVVLALVGILLSIVAAVRRAYERWRGIEISEDVALVHDLPSPPLSPRDRVSPQPCRRERPSHSRKSTATSRSTKSPFSDDAGPRTPLRASPESLLPAEELASTTSGSSQVRHRRQGRRQRTTAPMYERPLPSIDTAMESVADASLPSPVRPPLDVLSSTSGEDAVRALSSPGPLLGDSSTEPSVESMPVAEGSTRLERSPSPSRRVFQRLKDHHTQFQRCLSRVHSMPNAKSSKPVRRTDPYQAPYYFPTPLSPDADTYVQELRAERQCARTTSDPTTFRQYWEPIILPSPRSSPKNKVQPLPPAEPEAEIIQSETSEEPADLRTDGEHEAEGASEKRPRPVHHRWSWHLPLLPHTSKKMQSSESTPREAPALEKRNSSMFLFGHNRRRHGTASEDFQAKRTPVSQAAQA